MLKAAVTLSVAASALVSGRVVPASAQQPRPDWEPRGFDFTPDGVWRLRARRIAQLRREAFARGDFALLNSAITTARRSPGLFAGAPALMSASAAAAAVTGVLRIPTLLVTFRGVTPAFDTASYDQVLFGKSGTAVLPYAGRPYSVRTFYEELSHGLMSVQGVVVGWVQLDSAERWYTGNSALNPKCDGLCGAAHIAQLIQEAVTKADPSVNFAQFDSSNTGQVPLLWLIKPTIGAECGGDSTIWAHRYYYSAWTGTTLATADVSSTGSGLEQIDNYTIQSGLGGATACDGTAIMPPGTIAHETGHGLDLPDLYDVSLASQGIGHWGLMGSGNYATALNPAHMEAFSLNQLGWVAVAPLTANGTYTLSPVETSDTVFALRPPASAANPRHEYWLLETRRAINADSGLINLNGGGVGGLLVWHVDSTQFAGCTLPSNDCVNAGGIHGVDLMQADGLNQLGQYPGNRGDAGDPYPGTSGNTAFGPGTNPSVSMNVTTKFAGFMLDSIRSVSTTGPMTFRLRFGNELRVSVMGSGSVTSSTGPNAGTGVLVDSGTSVTLTAAAAAGATFRGWSGDTTASAASLVLPMAHSYRVVANFLRSPVAGSSYADTLIAGGSFGAFSFALAGGQLPPGVSLMPNGVLSGVPARDSSYSATVTASFAAIRLQLPVSLLVTAPQLSADSVVAQVLWGGSHLTADQVRYLDLSGNNNNLLDIGDVVAWFDRTGLAPSAGLLGRLYGRQR